jgi:large repetitive protein
VHTGDAVNLRIDPSHPSATVKIESETAAALAKDNFAFATNVQSHALAAAPVQHTFGTFDFSALTLQFYATSESDAMMVRAVEDHGGKFATLQVNSNSMGLKYGPTWENVEQLAGAHAGDAVNVLVDSHAAIHLAQIHVGWLV